MSKMDQMIAVIPAELVDFVGCVSAYRHSEVFDAISIAAEFKRRGDVEEDPTWLQLIPYTYIYNRRGELFTYRRRPTSGEVRLHGKVSIGVGGHLENDGDFATMASRIRAAAYRELQEELKFFPPLSTRDEVFNVFLLRLDNTPVDKVHLGIAMSLAYSGSVEPNDDEVEVVGWLKPDAILEQPEVEGWTKSLLLKLAKKGCNC